MMKDLLNLSILQFRRSSLLVRDAIQALFLVLFAVYMVLIFIGVGFIGGEIIRQQYPGSNILHIATAAVWLYFLADVLMRYFFQKYPYVMLRPLLVLPVPKSDIIHYFLRRSCIHFFNVLPLFALLPFTFLEIIPAYGGLAAAGFLTMGLALPLIAGFLGLALNEQLGINQRWPLILLASLIGVFYLEYSGALSLISIIAPVSGFIADYHIDFAVFPAALIFIYYRLHKHLRYRINADRPAAESSGIRVGGFSLDRLDFLSRNVRTVLELELVIVWRLPRAKQYFLSSFVILLLPLGGIGEPVSHYLILFYSFLVTSMVALNHGQLMLSWNSDHLDLLLSRGLKVKDIYLGKFYFLAGACVLTWVLALPYAFFIPGFFVYSTALLIYNASFSVYAYMLLATYSSKAIDTRVGGLMNMDGFGVGHYLIIIPIMVLPIILYAAGDLIAGPYAGLAALTIAGGMGLIFHRRIVGYFAKVFTTRKYIVSAEFRKSSRQ